MSPKLNFYNLHLDLIRFAFDRHVLDRCLDPLGECIRQSAKNTREAESSSDVDYGDAVTPNLNEEEANLSAARFNLLAQAGSTV